ncbi:MAG: CPBP family intramembrane metalloprotease [Frankiaceae bacterium]|nr:CPBP family intramembrane metalloprotease [Frankiaceae bacterium]
MRLRAQGLLVTLSVIAGLLAAFVLLGAVAPQPGGARAVEVVVGLAIAAAGVRLARCELRLEPDRVTIRNVLSTDEFRRADVLGLAIQPTARGRYRRIAVVLADDRVVAAPWTIGRIDDPDWANRAAWAAYGFGPTQNAVADRLGAAGRLDRIEQLPVATPDPGLTPATVSAVQEPAAARWLGWEIVFVIAAFALPAVAGAITLLAQHIGGVSDLDEFDLPLVHHAGVSLFLLLLGYSTTATIVPIALLLLARTGQPPASLGLTRRGFGRDTANALGIYAAIWAANLALVLAFGWLINNKHLTNTATNTHVPAYYIVYAIFLSATTAINEEVLVNGYFLTRLSQRGWSPRRAFWLSLAVRTSYHAYYGVGLILTVPLGYLVTRSFQKHQRLNRAIVVHFVNDAVLLTIAVLTS